MIVKPTWTPCSPQQAKRWTEHQGQAVQSATRAGLGRHLKGSAQSQQSSAVLRQGRSGTCHCCCDASARTAPQSCNLLAWCRRGSYPVIVHRSATICGSWLIVLSAARVSARVGAADSACCKRQRQSLVFVLRQQHCACYRWGPECMRNPARQPAQYTGQQPFVE